MTTTETCAGCRFWKRGHSIDEDSTEIGTCYRMPPRVYDHNDGVIHGWPASAEKAWCGEWDGVKGRLCHVEDDSGEGPCVCVLDDPEYAQGDCNQAEKHDLSNPADCPHYK